MAVKKVAAATAPTSAPAAKIVAPKATKVAAAPAADVVETDVVEAEAAVVEPPVVEELQETVAEAPASASGLVTELTKTQTEVSTHMDKVLKSAEEFVAFSQGNVEAFLKSGQILATGLQDLGKHVAATAQAQYDEAVANAKAFTSVKSVKEVFELQTTLAKTSFEKALAEAGKLTDASVKLAEQVSAPIAARVTVAVEKFGKVAA
jgi:phasin family protein